MDNLIIRMRGVLDPTIGGAKMKRSSGWMMAALTVGLSVAAAGPKWEIGEESWMQLSFLGQLQATYSDEAEPETDIFLRRARIILSGQITDGAQFFVETDNVNAGRHGHPDATTRIQDAFVDIRLAGSTHWIKAGLILLPFSFESRSGATALLGMDYNAEAIKLANTFIWRDYGVELHGNFGKRFSYAGGVFDGYDSNDGIKNTDADLRLLGHLAFNLVGEAETGWFFTQERMGKKGSYLSLGVGGDIQSKATRKPGEPAIEPDGEPGPDVVEDNRAWVVDMQSGYGLTEDLSLTFNAAWYDWDNAIFKGNTAFVESGLLYRRYMGLVKYTTQDPDEGSTANDVTVGFDYFHRAHNLRMGLEYRFGDNPDLWLARIQVLL